MTSWREKLRLTREALRTVPRLAIAFSEDEGEPDLAFVHDLQRQYPGIDAEYLAFLQETNGLQLDMYVLFGSRSGKLETIADGFRRWRPIIQDGGVPIGEDPSGDCFVLALDGTIRLISVQMDSVTEGGVAADSFRELLTDVLMGERFLSLVPGWTPANENEWTAHLRRQGWLTAPP